MCSPGEMTVEAGLRKLRRPTRGETRPWLYMNRQRPPYGLPPKQGLYDPRFEKDGCGIGFVVNIKGHQSHEIVEQSLDVLKNLYHRGAQGCDPCTGDGAGILLQVSHEFFRRACQDVGLQLPESGGYGVGMVFLPQDEPLRRQCEGLFESIIREEGLRFWDGATCR